MFARINSAATLGIEAYVVQAEVDITTRGTFYFSIVGLPDAAVKESKERVLTALKKFRSVCSNEAPHGEPRARRCPQRRTCF